MARRYKSRRAGSLAGLVNQAAVPFSIFALQNSYKKNKQGGKRTRKCKGGKRSRRHH
jgi:hypothetical protein